MRRIIPTALCICIVLGLCAGCASPEDVERSAQSATQQGVVINQPIREEPRLLTASGSAEVRLAPSRAVLTCTVQGSGATAAEALEACKAVSEAVRTAFDDSARLTLGQTETMPLFDEAAEVETVIGYECRADIEVLLTDYRSLGEKVLAAVLAGAGGEVVLTFFCDGIAEEYLTMVGAAAENAKASAASMAAAVGVTIAGTPYAVTETSSVPTSDSVTYVIGGAEEITVDVPVFAVLASVELVYKMP